MYELTMDDHCLVVKNSSNQRMYLNNQLCAWIMNNYEHITNTSHR